MNTSLFPLADEPVWTHFCCSKMKHISQRLWLLVGSCAFIIRARDILERYEELIELTLKEILYEFPKRHRCQSSV